MQIGIIGLGRMGGNMAKRLAGAGVQVHGYDRGEQARQALAAEPGIEVHAGLDTLATALAAPRVVWMMLPAGTPTEDSIEALATQLAPGDVLVDGANGHYRDAERRARVLADRGIEHVDAGVSGGIWGLRYGYGLMLGATAAGMAAVRPFVERLAPAPDRGWVHCGPPGAGHYAKMVHNGIEYGLMQAYAEGFALLAAKADLTPDVAAIAEAWRHGTVIRSWLLDLAAEVLHADAGAAGAAPVVPDSGEGRWCAQEAIDLGVPAPVLSAALAVRFSTQGRGDYAARLQALLRERFGGHPIERR